MDKIERNEEERGAFQALTNALLGNAPEQFRASAITMAEHVENELLKAGYVITKIEEITSLRSVADEVNAESRRSSSLGFFD